MSIAHIAFLLVAAHALCDYPLQGDFLAKSKNHKAPMPGVDWWIALLAHSAIHAGAVLLITESLWFGCCEFVMHSIIDWGKCEGHTSLRTDQALHLACKAIYVGLLLNGVHPI